MTFLLTSQRREREFREVNLPTKLSHRKDDNWIYWSQILQQRVNIKLISRKGGLGLETPIPGSLCPGVTLSLHRSLCAPLPRQPESYAYLRYLKVQEIGQSFIVEMENVVCFCQISKSCSSCLIFLISYFLKIQSLTPSRNSLSSLKWSRENLERSNMAAQGKQRE